MRKPMKRHRRLSNRNKYSLLLIPVVLAMFFSLLPLYIMLVGAVKPGMALYQIPADINPFTNITFKNFQLAIKRVDMLKAFANSMIISLGTCFITVVIGMMGGYAFAKRKFRGKRIWFVILMATMMLPKQVMMIPNYMAAYNMKLTNTLVGVILTSVNVSYAIFMCKQFISSIPEELIGAARIDGCTEWRVFFHVILPLSVPVMASLFIFTFIGTWNDFVWQNIMIDSQSLQTIPLALAHLNGDITINSLGIKMAGATISAIPMIIIFMFFQKYFIRGISDGAVKE